jgi:hypothetical protein
MQSQPGARRGWLADPGGRVDEVFFVNVLHGTGPDSDEEMERAIKKTGAAVDDCIFSRAKRAGLSCSRA